MHTNYRYIYLLKLMGGDSPSKFEANIGLFLLSLLLLYGLLTVTSTCLEGTFYKERNKKNESIASIALF